MDNHPEWDEGYEAGKKEGRANALQDVEHWFTEFDWTSMTGGDVMLKIKRKIALAKKIKQGEQA